MKSIRFLLSEASSETYCLEGPPAASLLGTPWQGPVQAVQAAWAPWGRGAELDGRQGGNSTGSESMASYFLGIQPQASHLSSLPRNQTFRQKGHIQAEAGEGWCSKSRAGPSISPVPNQSRVLVLLSDYPPPGSIISRLSPTKENMRRREKKIKRRRRRGGNEHMGCPQPHGTRVVNQPFGGWIPHSQPRFRPVYSGLFLPHLPRL